MNIQYGRIVRINGPLIVAKGIEDARLGDQVDVGDMKLTGEIISIDGELISIQIYEDPAGLKIGEPVYSLQKPLSVALAPGLVGSVYDGIQRPLSLLAREGIFIRRGEKVPPVDFDRLWDFIPSAREGETVMPLSIIGEVKETDLVTHRVMVPPGVNGKLIWIASAGKYRVTDTIAIVRDSFSEINITMLQYWPVRIPRPVYHRLLPTEPLITGQRIIDFLFPTAKGGACAIPGGFGTGKTVAQHQIAKWADVDLVVYIGCGERGNEMCQVLKEFSELKDQRTAKLLMDKAILIANTSNMPVTAREASIYTGITIAEYYRDMGYHVGVMADSTSRWAEAVREIADRQERIPAEEGYPAFLSSRIAEFYERAGYVKIKDKGSIRYGSVTVIGAVSPPGDDFSDPVVVHTKRFIKTFWALSRELANRRHFPSIDWNTSYSRYNVEQWWKKYIKYADWEKMRKEIMNILYEDSELQNIVRLVGPDVLPDRQKLILEVANMIKEGFLRQSAFSDIDRYCCVEKQLLMADVILEFYYRALEANKKGVVLYRITSLPVVEEIYRMKETFSNDKFEKILELKRRVTDSILALQNKG